MSKFRRGSVMFCRYCGLSLQNDSSFCSSCGKSLATESIMPPAPIARTEEELVSVPPPPPPSPGTSLPNYGVVAFPAEHAPPNKNAKSIMIAILAIPFGILAFSVSLNSIRYFWGGNVTMEGAISHALVAGIGIGLFSLLLYIRPRTMRTTQSELDEAARRSGL